MPAWPRRSWQPGASPRVRDTWIAATAPVHGAEVWTRDADFGSSSAVDVVRV
jgi:predicted nucleic acid-binding protein